jgi:hypothetical protein
MGVLFLRRPVGCSFQQNPSYDDFLVIPDYDMTSHEPNKDLKIRPLTFFHASAIAPDDEHFRTNFYAGMRSASNSFL